MAVPTQEQLEQLDTELNHLIGGATDMRNLVRRYAKGAIEGEIELTAGQKTALLSAAQVAWGILDTAHDNVRDILSEITS